MKWLSDSRERISFVLLCMWCLLPLSMCAYGLFMGATGAFPHITMENSPDGFVYQEALNTYYRCTAVLGAVTFLVALAAVLLSGRRLFTKKQFSAAPWFFLLLLMLLWTTVSTLLSDDPFYGWSGGTYFHNGLSTYCIYAGLFACASMIRTEQHRRVLLRLFGGVVCVLALVMLLQVSGVGADFLNYCFPAVRAVVFNQFNHFGYILCMGSMALSGLFWFDTAAGRGLKLVYLAGLALLIYALLVNNTFGAYLALIAALIVTGVFLLVRDRKAVVSVLVPLLLLVAVSGLSMAAHSQEQSNLGTNIQQLGTDVVNIAENNEEAANAGTQRLTLWKDTLERIKERPVFGFGPEGFYGENSITDGKNPHNEYLLIAGFHGIPALLLFLAALLTLAAHHWKRLKELDPLVVAVSGVTVGYLCSACFGNPVFNTAPFFWLFLGLTTATKEREKPLLCLEEAELEARLFAKTKVRRVAALLAVGAVLLAGVLLLKDHLAATTEKENEKADLYAMRLAALGVDFAQLSGELKATEFWFDAGTLSLIPASEPAPAPYGLGTARKGGGLADFQAEEGLEFDYDESMDYTDKILSVTVTEDASGATQTTVQWVESPSKNG